MKPEELAEVISRVDLASLPQSMLEQLALVFSAKAAEATSQIVLKGGQSTTPEKPSGSKPIAELAGWITVKEAAERYPLSARWFYRKAGALPFVKRVGARKILVHEPRLLRWLEKTG